MLLRSYVVHSLSRKVPFAGGDEEIRTLDPLLAGQVLSQLSYTPEFSRFYLLLSDPEN